MNLKRIADAKDKYNEARVFYESAGAKVAADLKKYAELYDLQQVVEDKSYYRGGLQVFSKAFDEETAVAVFDGQFEFIAKSKKYADGSFREAIELEDELQKVVGKSLSGFSVTGIKVHSSHKVKSAFLLTLKVKTGSLPLSSEESELNALLKQVSDEFQRYLKSTSKNLGVPVYCEPFEGLENSNRPDPGLLFRGKNPVFKFLKQQRLKAEKKYSSKDEIQHDSKVFEENPFRFGNEIYVIVPDRSWIAGAYTIKQIK